MERSVSILDAMKHATERPVRLPKNARAEGRASARFPMTLEVRYTVPGHRTAAGMGSGRSIDLSSSGLSFTADRPLRSGQMLEVSIDWPVLLGGGVRLQLIMLGVVVRTSGTTTALEVRRHEFRTRRGSNATRPQEAAG